jgi:hypothetical protein
MSAQTALQPLLYLINCVGLSLKFKDLVYRARLLLIRGENIIFLVYSRIRFFFRVQLWLQRTGGANVAAERDLKYTFDAGLSSRFSACSLM